jgi:hypothetical protein
MSKNICTRKEVPKMAIKWDPAAVDRKMDEIEAEYNKTRPVVERVMQLVKEAKEIPGIPGYLDASLNYLVWDCKRLEAILSSIERVRKDLPEKELARAKAQVSLLEVA